MSGWAGLMSRRPDPARWLSSGALAAGAAALLLAAIVGAPYAFDARLLDSEIAAQVRATTGLAMTTQGELRFALLPRPHIRAKGLRVSDPSKTLEIEAPEFEGYVRLLPLLVGRVELTGATLVRPHLTIDLDGRPMQPDSTIGRAMHAASPGQPDQEQQLGMVTLVDGTALVRSRRFPQAPTLSKVNVTIDWPDLESPATLTGSMDVQKTATEVAAWVAQPSTLMRGDRSPVTLSLRSGPLELTANGDLSSADTSTFRGHVSLSAPSGADLLALAGSKRSSPARFANLVLASDASAVLDHRGHGSLDLPNLHLRVDDNDYEGTLAVQSGLKPLVSGTLACDQLSLAPFFGALPPMVDAQDHWTRSKIDVSNGQAVDLDLRISANHLRAASFTLDDAALAVMTRNNRTEVALIEAKAYGGTVRGRVSFGLGGSQLSVRGAGSLEDVDAATLSWDAFGRQLATGRLSGSANLDASGDSPAALIAGLNGWLKADTKDGELSTIDLARTLAAGSGTGTVPVLEAGRTPFGSFALELRLANGLASIDQGAMSGADTSLALKGQVDVRDREVEVTAAASKSGDPAATRTLTISGPMGRLVVTPRDAPPPPSGQAVPNR